VPPPPIPRRRPPGRYDERSPLGHPALAALLAVLLVAGMALVALLLYDRFGNAPVRAQVVGFQVVSDRLVRIEVEVSKTSGSRAYCYLRARGADGAEVGRAAVTVDAEGTDARSVRLTHELATTALAVTGEAGRCSQQPLPPPASPRSIG
jgi:hypothetical protein